MKLTLKIHDVSAELDAAGDGVFIELPGQGPMPLPLSDEGAAQLVRLAQTLMAAAEPREAPEWPDVSTETAAITDASLGVPRPRVDSATAIMLVRQRCDRAELSWTSAMNFSDAREYGAGQCPCGAMPLAVMHTTGRYRIYCATAVGLKRMHRGRDADTLHGAVVSWNRRDAPDDLRDRALGVDRAAP